MKHRCVVSLLASLAAGVLVASTPAHAQLGNQGQDPNKLKEKMKPSDKQDEKAKEKQKEKDQEKAKQEGKHADKDQKGKGEGKDAKGEATAKVGQAAPDFTLLDTDGNKVALASLLKEESTKAVVLEWFNPQCPFVVKHHELHTTFKDLHEKYKDQGVVFVAINSGAKGEQGNGQKLNADMKSEWKITYPILLDESGTVGRAYGARTTPHMFVIGKDGLVKYMGAIDNNRSAREKGDKNYVDQALGELLKGSNVSEPETQPYGCSVKYGKGGKN